MMDIREVSSFLHHVIPGNMNFITNDSLENRNLRKVSSFCHSAKGNWKIVSVSFTRDCRSSSSTLAFERKAPVGHPRYL